MVPGRGPRLWLEEVVVNDVQRDDSETEPSQARLSPKGGRDARYANPSGFGNRMRDGTDLVSKS